jgi:hypothetical protein
LMIAVKERRASTVSRNCPFAPIVYGVHLAFEKRSRREICQSLISTT